MKWTEAIHLGLTISGYELDISPDGTNWGFGTGIDYGADVRNVDFTYAQIRNQYLVGETFTNAYFRARAKVSAGDQGLWSQVASIAIPTS